MPTQGGTLIVALRNEPRTYNSYFATDANSGLLTRLTQATLLRIDRTSGALEPRLASSWTGSADGRTWTFHLRPAEFSDGQPFTSADVVFSFQTVYDAKVASPLAAAIEVAGAPLAARAVDDHTVTITFPAASGPGLALLDSLPILPKHALAAALADGSFDHAWSMATPPSALAGLGPFMVGAYTPGEQVHLVRNPHFWGRDERGVTLPYLDAIDLQIVPDQNAEILRLESGAADLITDEARPEDVASLRTAEQHGLVRVVDAGDGLDPSALWFNLVPGAKRAQGRPWLQREELRFAISYAVDRQAIADRVFLGAAEPIWGPITPGFGPWYVPDLPRTERDLGKAKALLASIGLVDRNGDGLVDDAGGRPVRLAVLTLKGNSLRERTMAVLQQQVRQIGLSVDVVPLEQGALIDHFLKDDYDAIYTGFQTDATDPARNLDFWMSSGATHFWDPGQAKPATDWEARIDALMAQQATETDPAKRRAIFADVQRVFAAHRPALYFVAPRVLVPMSARLLGATPVPLKPTVLWNAERLRLGAPASSR